MDTSRVCYQSSKENSLNFVFNINSLCHLLTFTLLNNIKCDNLIMNFFPQEFCPENWFNSSVLDPLSHTVLRHLWMPQQQGHGASQNTADPWTNEHELHGSICMWSFFNSKYCSTTQLMGGWIHRCGTWDEPHVGNLADYKLYTDFWLCRGLTALTPQVVQGSVLF